MNLKKIEEMMQGEGFKTWITCDICGVGGPQEGDNCPCCGWPFSSVMIVSGPEQVRELCHNVFKYSHALFLEQIKAYQQGIGAGMLDEINRLSQRVKELEQRWIDLKNTLQNDYKQGHREKAGRALLLMDEYEGKGE